MDSTLAGRRPHTFVVVLLVFVGWVSSATGQPSQSENEEATPKWLGMAFEQRTRAEKMTNEFRIDELGATQVLAFRTRFQFEIKELIDPIRFYVEIQDSRSEWNDDPFVVPSRHINKLDFKQIQLQVITKTFLGIGVPSRLQVGRYTMDFGKRRLSARNRMRNTTNAFDGVHWWLGTNENWMFRAFANRPVELKPEELDTSDNRRLYWGGYLQLHDVPVLGIDLYYLGLHEDESTITQRTYTTIGGRAYQEPHPGRLDYEIETTWQFGTTRGSDHFAHFQHGELGYVFDSVLDSRLSFHYDYASGDEEPDDDKFGRFSTLFGARRFEFNPTGVYGPFFRGNLHSPGIRIAMVPSSRWEIMASYRWLWLAEAKDAWVGSGLRDPTGQSGSNLGNHIETRIRFRPHRYILVEGGYAHFFKGFLPGPRSLQSPHAGLQFRIHRCRDSERHCCSRTGRAQARAR